MRRSFANKRSLRQAATIIALVGFASLATAPNLRADGLYWGLFQENLPPSHPNYPGNCWSQAMISGDAINGVLLQGQLTQQQAQDALTNAIQVGTCKDPTADDN